MRLPHTPNYKPVYNATYPPVLKISLKGGWICPSPRINRDITGYTHYKPMG